MATATADLKAKLEAAVAQSKCDLDAVTPRLRKGAKAIAVKGRKVKIGTTVEIFWIGSTWNRFTHSYDVRMGVVLPDGRTKVWVSADNFDPLPSPIDIQDYSNAKYLLALSEKALADYLSEVDDGNLEEAKLANDEVREAQARQETPEARRERLMALIPPSVLVREMVRDAFGDEAVAEREEVVLGEQEVQMGDG